MTTFSIIHNIPSPYRLHLFSVMDQALKRQGGKLHVHFMATGHADRKHWKAEASHDLPFEASFWPDVGPQLRGKEWHLNPGLIGDLLRSPPDYLMVGGPWDSLTGLASCLARGRKKTIAWFEGNTKTPGLVSGPVGWAKRLVLSRHDVLAVPGQEGAALARLILAGHDAPPIVTLPNLVDESRFSPRADDTGATDLRRELGLSADRKIALWIARMIPAKGILPFLTNISRAELGDWTILLLGDGPLRPEIDSLIERKGLAGNFRVMSSYPYERMPSLYRSVDLFLLPSVHDPNPLSVVEAMHSGLPILTSTQIGNLPEAIAEGINGWAFNPHHPEDVRSTVTTALATPPAQLRQMGEESRKRAQLHWSSTRAIDAFLEAVLS